ncbi:oligosaccharide flippase family protein [Candidatus Bipolaricaulota bacterium]
MAIEKTVSSQEDTTSTRDLIVRHIAKFSLASLIGGIGSFFNTYFAALLLGPAVWGIWQGAKLVLQYSGNLHFGVRSGMHRELPILRGRKESAKQTDIINVAFTFNFIAASIVALGILCSTFLISMSPELRLSLQFISMVLFLQYVSSFYGILFRANNQFNIVSRVALINGLGSIVSIALIVPLGLVGFLSGQVLRLLITTTYCWRKCSQPIHWSWNGRVLQSLIVIGFPIMLLSFVSVIFITVDRLLILTFLDASNLGVYSLGTLLFIPFTMLFTASNSVMYPRFTEKYGATGDPGSLRRHITVPLENLAASIPILIGAIYIALPFLVRTFLPDYAEGILTARILMLGFFFSSLSGMTGNMLLTINKQVLYLGILSGGVLLNLGLSYGALKLGYGIVGVAAATSVTYILYFATSGMVAMRFAKLTSKAAARVLLRVLGPVVYVAIVVVSISALFPITATAPLRLLLQSIVREAVFVACVFYLLYRLIYNSQLGRILLRAKCDKKAE